MKINRIYNYLICIILNYDIIYIDRKIIFRYILFDNIKRNLFILYVMNFTYFQKQSNNKYLTQAKIINLKIIILILDIYKLGLILKLIIKA